LAYTETPRVNEFIIKLSRNSVIETTREAETEVDGDRNDCTADPLWKTFS